MIHTYAIEGMENNDCAKMIATQLAQHPKVIEANISLEKHTAVLRMKQHIPIQELQRLLTAEKKYGILQADAPAMPLEDGIDYFVE